MQQGSSFQGYQPYRLAEQELDHPERMLFYAMIGGILCWSLIGLFSWMVWKLTG